jgi:sarcosine oxidase subunit beta
VTIPGAVTTPLKPAYEAVVIGGGVHGLAVAYELGKRGVRDIAVIERSYPGSGASGRNGELIRSAFSSVEWIRFFDLSVKRWPLLSAELDFNVLFVPGGYLVLASSDEDLERCRSAAERQRACGLDSRVVSPGDVMELAPGLSPDVVRGGVFQPSGGYAHHDAVLWAYAAAAGRQGAEIHPYTLVTAVHTSGGAVTGVATDRGDVSAPIVINAAGAFSRDVAALAGVDLALGRYRVEALATESVKPFVRCALSPITLHAYAHQTSRGEFVGGTEFALPDASDSLRGTQPLLIDMARKFVQLFPQLAGVRVIRHWAGLVSQTADMAPVLGPVPELSGFHLSCGWLYGFMGVPATGELLAESIVSGRVPEPMAPFGLERLRTGAYVFDDSLIQKPAAAQEAGA